MSSKVSMWYECLVWDLVSFINFKSKINRMIVMFLAVAANEFSKIYYPYGIIIRNSIPISWATYVRQRAPITLFFIGAW